MSRLAGYPGGLLSLLQSQSFGEAPKDLSDVISPVVDIAGLYLLTAQRPALAIVAAPANGQNQGAGLIVPAGEVWRIHAGGVLVQHGAGDTGTYTPIINNEGISMPCGNTVDMVATSERWLPIVQTPFWLRAGQELSVSIFNLVGVPTLVAISCLASRLRA